MPIDSTILMAHVPSWLLVLFRLSGIFILAPVLGSQTIPRYVKAMLVFVLSVAVYPMLLTPGRPSLGFIEPILADGLSLWTLVPMIGVELLLGFIIGYCASLPLVGMQIGGHVIDQQMGLGLANIINPEFGESSGVMGEFFFMMGLAIFCIMGGHHVLFATLIGSFDNIPLGGFSDFGSLVDLAVGLITLMFEMAFRIAAPLLCLIFLQTVAMGFIARTVPQMNILSVGFAIRIMAGASFLIFSVAMVAHTYNETMHFTLQRVMAFMLGG